MKFIVCFLTVIGSILATYAASIGELENVLEELEELLETRDNDEYERGTLKPFEYGESANDYHNNLKGKNDCPNGMTRKNINAQNFHEYHMRIKPNDKDQHIYYALDGSKKCLEGEIEPNCTGTDNTMVTMRYTETDDDKREELTIETPDNQEMSVRQFCTWSFGVLKVKVKLHAADGSRIMSKAFKPAENSDWFNYGCTTNGWKHHASKLTFVFENSPPTYNIRNIYAEVCW